jgi:hypothetical protein
LSNILILVIILILLFATDKFKEIARIALTISIVAFIVLSIISKSATGFLMNQTNFLLLVVIYILLFGAQKFKEKYKIAIVIILGVLVLFYSIGIIGNMPSDFKQGDIANILLGALILIGSLILGYFISAFWNNRNKR